MHIRTLTLMLLALATMPCLAQETQSAIDWPPKAVPNQEKGNVPDASAENKVCLDCHRSILDVKTARKNIPNPHRLHLTSKKTAFGGANRYCATCHDMVTQAEGKATAKEGWFVSAKGNVYHPNVMQNPRALWKKLVVRGGEGTQYSHIDALQQAQPHPYKPTLGRLVCADCHGPESGIKTFYGAPEAR